jgi:UMF1 family MFS transporter
VALQDFEDTGATGASGGQSAPMRALVSWVLFEWALQPFYTLILTFLFAPYFVNVVVGDTARGQSLWGYAAAVAGILIAFGSPVLGALADGRGRRKPWIALFVAIIALGMATLWMAVPSAPGATVVLVLAAFVVATAAAEFTTVFTNAIMPGLVPPEKLGRLSGFGWATGYAGGLISLVLMAGLIAANPATGKTLLGLDPLFKLDLAAREGDRLVGPFSAVWFLIFVLPFFLFVPDVQPVRRDAAMRKSALGELLDTLRSLLGHPDILLFLLARMIYIDGLTAIFTFGGIYGSAVFGWQALELGLFGIILTLTGAIGAVIGGFFDDHFGSKAIILTALLLLIIGALGILSVDKSHVLYWLEVAPKAAGSKPFSSTGELVFLAFALIVGVVAAPVQAASRSLLGRLAPKEKMTQFFGLFAFSGKVTAFMAPLLVASVTAFTGSPRIGMAAILVFLVLGMMLMAPVRTAGVHAAQT